MCMHAVQVWPHRGANKRSVGELLVEFFEYLAAFPFDTRVRIVLPFRRYLLDHTTGTWGTGY